MSFPPSPMIPATDASFTFAPLANLARANSPLRPGPIFLAVLSLKWQISQRWLNTIRPASTTAAVRELSPAALPLAFPPPADAEVEDCAEARLAVEQSRIASAQWQTARLSQSVERSSLAFIAWLARHSGELRRSDLG